MSNRIRYFREGRRLCMARRRKQLGALVCKRVSEISPYGLRLPVQNHICRIQLTWSKTLRFYLAELRGRDDVGESFDIIPGLAVVHLMDVMWEHVSNPVQDRYAEVCLIRCSRTRMLRRTWALGLGMLWIYWMTESLHHHVLYTT